MKPVKRKYLEKKLNYYEQEIKRWESKENSASINLRQSKENWFETLEALEEHDTDQGE